MADVTVYVVLRKKFKVTCKGTSSDECIDDIIDNDLLDDDFLEECKNAMTITEGTYDEPEPEDNSSDEEEEAE
jgi:hypothetical protein